VDGTVYDGEWKRDFMHGAGTLTSPSGEVYRGDFNMGKKHGQGTLQLANGQVISGQWRDDQQIESKQVTI